LLLNELEKSLAIIDRIIKEISFSNNQLLAEKKLNPNNLAKNVWQSIWLASGENPDMCLSTFVEIFIFRYLSDLEILKKNNAGVPVDFDSVKNSGKNTCLKYYFENVRKHVKELFPESKHDNTSIINSFILDPRISEHNQLFYNILVSFSDFLTNEDGDEIKLVNIDPKFKSRLYEDFLKRSISQKNWGQFFTPRNVIKALIEVSDIEKLNADAKVGDPACGVGGFLLEPLLTKITNAFYIKENQLLSKFTFEGSDRDPKVIIMAKANMLIYLSELLRDNPTLTHSFSEMINKVFKSYHTSILGSLSKTEKDKYNLIMTNPPYVTKGIVNYKDAINNNGSLKEYYVVNGMGVECFFIEKIINELKSLGKAFIIIPDGILNRVNDYKIRAFIKKHCTIEAIVSLPIGTFYSTQKKTYILAITKKKNSEEHQTENVFGYIVTSIGESLDVYRTPIPSNDLKDFVRQYKYFQLDKALFQPLNINCKLFTIDKFDPKTNWCVDRLWDKESKIELGIEEEINIVDIDEYHNQVKRVNEEISIYNIELGKIDRAIASLNPETEQFTLSQLFNFKQGDAYYTLKRIKENAWEGTIPVYSSNTKNFGILAYISKDKIREKDKFYDYSLTWAIDGMAGQLFLRNEENKLNLKEDKYLFTLNNHCGIMIPKEKIDFYFNNFYVDRKNELALNGFLSEFKSAFEAAIGNDKFEEIDKAYKKLFNSLIITCPVNADSLKGLINNRIAENVYNSDDEILFTKGDKLTEELLAGIINSGLETIKINIIIISKKDNILEKWSEFSDNVSNISEDSYNIFYKEILPLITQHYCNRIEIDLRYIITIIRLII